MILIACPWCGARNSAEFRYVGESRPRPDVTNATPEEWRRYLYLRSNPAGWTTETWFHRAGCRRYFTAERHTVTNEIRVTRRPSRQLEERGEP
jgi:heterotetrameric sarcosine oxidase delta subunit